MKNIRILSEKFQFLEVEFSIDLHRRVFIMCDCETSWTSSTIYTICVEGKTKNI